MPEYHVRSIRKKELGKLLDLYKHLFEKADAPLPPDEQLAQLWDQITDNPLLHYFVGEIDGQIVSSCTMTIIPNLTRGARPYGLIENVVTHRDYRKRGYGTQMLRHALQVAWDHDCYKVMLLTGRKDEATLRFYERAGFKPGVKTGFIAYPEK
ncbi:MAG: GNAT family N-acetyltransferase [Anaerolineae bacterium]|jgi:GNAT superfamily N-acetyltransferase